MKCPHCGTPAETSAGKVKAVILWASPHGMRRRIICRACNWWTDTTHYKHRKWKINRVTKGEIRPC